MTIDRTWGYRKNILMKDIKTPDYMIQQIVRTSKLSEFETSFSNFDFLNSY